MFQLNDDFLKELGLDSLPPEQKQAFLETIYAQLEQKVGMRLSEGLSDEQLREFESFMDRDEEKTRAWLAAHAPSYPQDPTFVRLQQSVPQTDENGQPIPEVAVLAEYASLKWLSMNRPDYREVVRAVLDQLKQEIVANRSAILGENPEAGASQNQAA